MYRSVILVALIAAILHPGLRSGLAAQGEDGRVDGPYVKASDLQNFIDLVALADITKRDKQSPPRFERIDLFINVKEVPSAGGCRFMSADEVSALLMQTVTRRMSQTNVDTALALRERAKRDLDKLFSNYPQLQVRVGGGRGQGYEEGNVDECIIVYVRELSAAERAEAANRRRYDCIKLVTKAVEWEE